ncbi:MAG: hypothetical protein MUF42_09355 [Cytophagaceae bacterium]|jgi:hypothetical protein|nr:hypothetical protein [Cytophagaceae bacterium]
MKHLPALLLCLLSAPMALLGQQELFLQLKKGSSLKSVLNTDMIMHMEMGQKKMSVPTNTVVYSNILVKEVAANGNLTFEFEVTRIIMDIQDQKTGQTQHYDSDKPEDTKEYKKADERFRSQIGKKSWAVYSNKGALISKDTVNSNSLSELILLLPEGKLEKGSTWTEEKNTEMSGMNIKLSTEYLVKSVEEEYVLVESISKGEILKEPLMSIIRIHRRTGMIAEHSSKGLIDMGLMKIDMSNKVLVNGM